jgi:hypothetical protein
MVSKAWFDSRHYELQYFSFCVSVISLFFTCVPALHTLALYRIREIQFLGKNKVTDEAILATGLGDQ